MNTVQTVGRESVREQHIRWLLQAARRKHPLPSQRIDRAWKLADEAARLLRQRYGVARVRVFGSLLYPSQFHNDSDVDLAVEGSAVDDFWDALADVMFLDEQITVDLVDPELCPSEIWETVEQEGVDLESQPTYAPGTHYARTE